MKLMVASRLGAAFYTKSPATRFFAMFPSHLTQAAMRMACLAILTAFASGASEIEGLGYKWDVPDAKEWRVSSRDGASVMEVLAKRPPVEPPRRPVQFALAQTVDFRRVEIDVEVKRNEKSLIIVYAWKDANHFNYAHLSGDEGTKVAVHNGIFHVYGGDRVRISDPSGPASLPTEEWTKVNLRWDGKSGRCVVLVNGKPVPALEGVDLSLRSGRVGLGSFFETAQFRNLRIRGEQ